MYKAKYVVIAALVSVLFFSGRAVALEKDSLDLINKAVFEVIIPKPVEKNLIYEKPLPMDLIPFAIRNDKYYSVGTAFAVSPTELVTAAHVLQLDRESQIKDIFVRDSEGNVYDIDKIIKYSSRRDFAVFTLKNKILPRFFRTNLHPAVNRKVYAVGNALGQGIVVRDGLYTSNTPEDLEGEWKWIRFSAAASPGNSGGPLLDEDGNVIGVVVLKSPNENLNMALPFTEVAKAKENTAAAFWKAKYFLDNMDMTKTRTFSREYPLPEYYKELRERMTGDLTRFVLQLLKELLADNRDAIFPRGQGAVQLLNSSLDAVFPGLIAKGDDGNWSVFFPKTIKDADLGNNGHINYGVLGHTVFMYMAKPENMSNEAFYKDSKGFMDLILKGIYLHRNIGSEKIKIVSMGKAQKESVYTDHYGRKWEVREWTVEYNDTKLVTFSLPIPGGYVTMMRDGQTGLVDCGHIPDLKALSDFVYLSYYGTLKQWKAFLAMKDMLPAAFSDIDIAFDYNRDFSYRSKRIRMVYDSSAMKIAEDSDLKLRFAYFKDGGWVVWDVQSVSLGEEKGKSNSFYVSRHVRPDRELGDKYQNFWRHLENRDFPYNRSAYFDDKVTVIAGRYIKSSVPAGNAAAASDVLYSVGYLRDGNVDQKQMESGLDRFLKGLTVEEPVEGDGINQRPGPVPRN